jgi:hypothetical protein
MKLKELINKIEELKEIAIKEIENNRTSSELSKRAHEAAIRINIYKEILEMIRTTDLSTISDGYHSFKELYFHRVVLFSIICSQNKEKAWKSKLHADGTMYDNYFIVGINTLEHGKYSYQYSYHYSMEHWKLFEDIKELPNAPEWDGHKPEDINRLFGLL